MAKKKSPPSETPVTILRKRPDPEVTPAPPEEEVEVVAEYDDALRTITAALTEEQKADVRTEWTAGHRLTAVRKFQGYASDAGAPELARPQQRACCIAILAEAPPSPIVADDATGSGDEEPAPMPPAPVERKTGKHVIGKRVLDREVAINETEFTVFALDLAKCEQASRELALAHKAVRAKMKQETDDSNANRARLADIVAKRVEVRPVTVVTEVDYDLGCVREIDEASGNVLETRPLKPEEMQVPLFQGLAEVERAVVTATEGKVTLEVIEGGRPDDEQEDDEDPE